MFGFHKLVGYLNSHYLKKDYSPFSYYIATKILICFTLCSKLFQTDRFVISTMPKCLSDIMLYESRGT
jgi:hypothetical protein